jgi:hypothetical protein
LLTPAAAGDNAKIKFSADLAHLLAFPLGWLSTMVGRKRQLLNQTQRRKNEQ